MAIPGTGQFSGQPTVTNPLNQAAALVGQVSRAQQTSEARSTQTVQAQPVTQQIRSAQVVNQAEEAGEFRQATDDNPATGVDLYA